MALEVTPDGFVIDTEAPQDLVDLNGLLQSLPGFALITEKMKLDALAQALVPDAVGVWPGESGYVYSYDIYWAAIQLIGFLQAQPVVRQTSSEGTSVAVDAPNWEGLIAYYRSLSRIAQSAPGGVLNVLPIPDGPHVVRTDMSGRYDSHGDIDTDLA